MANAQVWHFLSNPSQMSNRRTEWVREVTIRPRRLQSTAKSGSVGAPTVAYSTGTSVCPYLIAVCADCFSYWRHVVRKRKKHQGETIRCAHFSMVATRESLDPAGFSTRQPTLDLCTCLVLTFCPSAGLDEWGVCELGGGEGGGNYLQPSQSH